jgi:hypothetical protein
VTGFYADLDCLLRRAQQKGETRCLRKLSLNTLPRPPYLPEIDALAFSLLVSGKRRRRRQRGRRRNTQGALQEST